jgi:hypothetical protein
MARQLGLDLKDSMRGIDQRLLGVSTPSLLKPINNQKSLDAEHPSKHEPDARKNNSKI